MGMVRQAKRQRSRLVMFIIMESSIFASVFPVVGGLVLVSLFWTSLLLSCKSAALSSPCPRSTGFALAPLLLSSTSLSRSISEVFILSIAGGESRRVVSVASSSNVGVDVDGSDIGLFEMLLLVNDVDRLLLKDLMVSILRLHVNICRDARYSVE